MSFFLNFRTTSENEAARSKCSSVDVAAQPDRSSLQNVSLTSATVYRHPSMLIVLYFLVDIV